MKNLSKYVILELIISLFMISCDTDIDSGFSIRFSDGTVIHEEDISFYDSSTCILFLKDELSLTIGPDEPPYSFIEFSVIVDDEMIYQGIIYPDLLFTAWSPEQIFISSGSYPIFESNIIQIKFDKEVINDCRIIKSLKASNLLHNGITCSIDSVSISSYSDSSARFAPE